MTGLAGMLIVARRTSPKERGDAATHATQQALSPPTQTEADEAAMTATRKRRRGRRG